jgi:5'-nucleotidase
MSDGLRALAGAVEGLGEVWVVAPETEQSAASHAISIHRPLRIRQVRPRWFAVDGTPTDCSYMAVNHILKDRRPALMLSGINHGPNLADDVTYSGTVAAAIEASLLGFPPSPSAWPCARTSTSARARASRGAWPRPPCAPRRLRTCC